MTHRVLLALLITIVLAAGADAQTNSQKSKGTDVSAVFNPFFQMYCATCHNQSRKTAGLALDTLNTTDVSQDTAVWEKVLLRLRTRRDPPPGSAPSGRSTIPIGDLRRRIRSGSGLSDEFASEQRRIVYPMLNWLRVWRNSSGMRAPTPLFWMRLKKVL